MWSLVIAMSTCPPLLDPFDVQRSTIDGLTYSTGSLETDTRIISTNYVDNRTTSSTWFWSSGEVQMRAVDRPRRIRYRMSVDLPTGVREIVQGKQGKGYEACIREGRLVVVAATVVDRGVIGVVSWDVHVDVGTDGDIDGDGDVDGDDLGLLLASWGSPGPGDLDGDGTTDGTDMGILFTFWTG